MNLVNIQGKSFTTHYYIGLIYIINFKWIIMITCYLFNYK
jgi:hypothetical protein